MALKITYTLSDGALPITVSIVGAGISEERSSYGTYDINDVLEGQYILKFVDSNGCTSTEVVTLVSNTVDVNCIISSNAASYLTTPTYDGSGQAVHPDIYYNPYGWNGYKYWMAMTPYPNGNDSYENPSVLVSNDGTTWSVPAGLTNPIQTPSVGHLADCDIIFNPYDSKLYIFFNEVSTNSVLYYTSSSDGINWSTRTAVSFETASYSGQMSIIYDNGAYKMFTVPTGGTLRTMSSTSLTGTWEDISACSFTNMPVGKMVWHIEVMKYGEQYHMVIVLATSGGGAGSLPYFATSSDGVTWTLTDTQIINKSVSGWDNSLVYRGTSVLMNNEGTYYYDHWYSANNVSNIWHVGKTIINLFDCNPTTTTTTTTVIPATTTTTTQSIELKTNLISVWELDETSGTATEDSHGVNDGTITGVTINQTGKINKAYSFDGSDYVSMGDVIGLERTDSFSISAWIKVSGTGFYIIAGKMANAAPYRGYAFTMSNGVVRLEMYNTFSSNIMTRATIGQYNNNNWRHVVCTYPGTSNADNIVIYIDGVSVSCQTVNNALTATILNTTIFSIGSRDTAGGLFVGLIDQVAVWNKVLTVSEVSALYNSGNGLAYSSWLPLVTTTTTTSA